jgi:hypothetical protein
MHAAFAATSPSLRLIGQLDALKRRAGLAARRRTKYRLAGGAH